MDLREFLDHVKKDFSMPLWNLYGNLQDFERVYKYVNWVTNTSLDVILSNPNFLHQDLDFLGYEEDEEDEAATEIGEITTTLYNQLFVALFSYFETFLNDCIQIIYENFFKEANENRFSETSFMILNDIEKKRDSVLNAGVENKLRAIKAFGKWNRNEFKEIKQAITKHQKLRNRIAHSRGEENPGPMAIQNINKPKPLIVKICDSTLSESANELLDYSIRINRGLCKYHALKTKREGVG